MASKTIHVLPETEPFSEFNGGAISRWVANVLRGDTRSKVVCPETDFSWTEISNVKTERGLARYRTIRHIAHKAGWSIRTKLLRHALEPALGEVREGDIVWVHNRPDSAAAIRPLVHRVGAKLVLHMHNSHLLNVTPKQFAEIKANCLVFVSKYLCAESAQLHKAMANYKVLYNGADDRIFHPGWERPRDHNDPVVLFAGRLVPDKGAHIFVAAMRELKHRGIAGRGIVVGASGFGGSKATDFVHTLRRDAPDTVTFLPYCVGRALGDLFRRADIFCIPSVWQDPFPLAPLEAMATGLPVVASRSGGIPEALKDGGGVLVEPGSITQLADALEVLIRDPKRRAQLASDGHGSYKRNFTWNAVRTNYDAVAATV